MDSRKDQERVRRGQGEKCNVYIRRNEIPPNAHMVSKQIKDKTAMQKASKRNARSRQRNKISRTDSKTILTYR